jgi:prepilin signal peptidase PulO-like enzyme (type II secretory pathway)
MCQKLTEGETMFSIIITYTILSIYLIICTITDIKSKKINLPISLFFLLAGILIQIFILQNSFKVLSVNLLTGLLLCVISKITNGAVGLGDALIFIIMSFYMPSISTIYILFFALIFASFFSIILLFKKYSKKYVFPFAPFICFGFLIFLYSEYL